MTEDPASFIHAQTSLCSPPLVPELSLCLAAAFTPLWSLMQERLAEDNLPPPYWAAAWPGGQGVARYVLDHPEQVSGKRVLDIGSGSGLCALAAARAGARSVCAVDCDPLARVAEELNASANGLCLETKARLDFTKPYRKAEVILAGDVCYQQAMSTTLLRWLRLCVASGLTVLLGDPGRAYVPDEGLEVLARYVVPTSRDLEDRDSRTVTVWRMVPFFASEG
ncbi:MAG: 50S ribosomal protein L11 methyltransferase [Alphaproteobacteria bacterium]|nr:50S ribosomal protein L11 methyltransferase [Alphaproteobacteria bacterium]